jgi:hypothetical protein
MATVLGSRKRIGQLVIRVGVVAVGQDDQVGLESGRGELQDPEARLIVGKEPSRSLDPQPQQPEPFLGQAEHPAARPLLLFAQGGFGLVRRRVAEGILDAVRARAEHEQADRIPPVPEQPQGDARGFEVVGMGREDEDPPRARKIEPVQPERARPRETGDHPGSSINS